MACMLGPVFVSQIIGRLQAQSVASLYKSRREPQAKSVLLFDSEPERYL
jgi:hypothetical protein